MKNEFAAELRISPEKKKKSEWRCCNNNNLTSSKNCFQQESP
jgi:hypothetical protein